MQQQQIFIARSPIDTFVMLPCFVCMSCLTLGCQCHCILCLPQVYNIVFVNNSPTQLLVGMDEVGEGKYFRNIIPLKTLISQGSSQNMCTVLYHNMIRFGSCQFQILSSK